MPENKRFEAAGEAAALEVQTQGSLAQRQRQKKTVGVRSSGQVVND
jgi:hypothetical protein